MIRAEAIQQVLMALVLLAAAIAIKLSQQVRVLLGGSVGRAGLALEAARAHAKSSSLESLFVFLVHAVVAVVLLTVIFASANGMKASARQDS